MKTKIYRPFLLILIGLFIGINANQVLSQVTANAVLNNDCSTASLTGSDPTPFTGTWTCSDGGVTYSNPNDPTATAFNIPFNTTVTFTWTVNGVSASDIINGFVYPVANAGVDLFPCTPNINLSATPVGGGETGIWDRTQGLGTIGIPSAPNTPVTGLGLGQNVFRWRVTNPTTGCQSEDLVTVLYLPVTASAGPADTVRICDNFHQMAGNDLASLTIGTYTATGLWEQIPPTAPGIIVDPTSPTTMVTDLDWDDNLFRWTVTNGYCSDFDEIVIQNNSPALPFAGNDTTICDTTYFLSGNNPTLPLPGRGTGEWTVVSGGATIVDPTLYNTEVTDLAYYAQPNRPDYWNTVPAINRFEWTVTYKGCSRSDIVEVINGLPLPIHAGYDQVVCDTTVALDAICEGSGAMRHWWTELGSTPGLQFNNPIPGDSRPGDEFYNSFVSGIQAGTTSFIWWKENTLFINTATPVTCLLSDTVEVFSKGLVKDLNAGSDFSFCADTAQLNADSLSHVFSGAHASDVVTGYWTITHGTGVFDNSTDETTTVRQMAYDTNVYRWNVYNVTESCLASDDVYITNALPSDVSAGAPQPNICTDRTTLVANRPVRGTGVWQVHSGSGTFENPSCSGDYCNSYVTNIDPGVNVYFWTVTNNYFGPPKSDISCSLSETVTITNNMITANPGNTINMCADTAQLHANDPSGTWTTQGAAYLASTGINSSSLYNDIVRDLTLGKNTISWTVTNGYCIDSKNLIVWNNLPDPYPYAGVDQVVCSDSATLTGNTILRDDIWYDITGTIIQQEGHAWGEWTPGNGSGTIESSLNRITKVHGIPMGSSSAFVWNAYYQFQDYVSNQTHTCQLSDTVVITNNSVIANAGSNIFQCGIPGGTATVKLGAVAPTSPATGLWSTIYAPPPGSTIVTPTSDTSSVTGMYDGTHQYKWTVSRIFGGVNCTNSDIVDVVVPVPSLANANAINELMVLSDSVEVCIDSVTLQADPPVFGSGTWSVLSGADLIADKTSTTTTAKGLLSNINKQGFIWTINHLGCFSLDTAIVMSNGVNADASVGFDADTSICSSNFQLIGNDPNFYNFGTGTYPFDALGQWNATIGITINDNTLYNTVISGIQDGGVSNVLTWTITKGGCSDSDQLTIYNHEFNITANGPYNTCDGTVTLNGESPGLGGTGLWTKGSPSSGIIHTPFVYNTSMSGISIPGNNEYIWTVNRNGCTAIDAAIVVNNKVLSNAGPDINVCADTTSFKGITPTVGVGTWSPIITGTGGAITIANPTTFNSYVSGLGLGLNRFTWTVSNGFCSTADTMDIINDTPSAPVTQADDEICSTLYTLNADNPVRGTGSWEIISGSPAAIIQSSLSNITLVENIAADTTTFKWTVTNGICDLSKNVTLTNNIVYPDAGLDQQTCMDSVELEAANDPSAIGHYWSIEAGSAIIENSTLNKTWVKNLGLGTSTFRWTLEKGICEDHDLVEITNYTVKAIASDLVICELPVRLVANNPALYGGTGLWNDPTNTITYIDGPSFYNTRIDNVPKESIITLQWNVTNGVCKDSTQVHITNNGFDINAGVNDTVCENLATLSAENRGTGYWEVRAGTGIFDNSTNPGAAVTGLQQGDNLLRWTVADNGCQAFGDVIIRNNEVIVSAGTNDMTCDNFYNLIGTPLSANATGLWSGGGNVTIQDPGASSTLVENLSQGTNTFTWTVSENGCTGDSTIIITSNHFIANAGSDQYPPSDFTPMNAGLPTGGTGLWKTYSGSGTPDDPTDKFTTMRVLGYGLNEFIWEVTWNGCIGTDTVSIIYNPVIADAGNDTSICANEAFLKGNNPYPASGKWTVVEGTGDFLDDTNPLTQVTNVQRGKNVYRWTVSINGASTSDDVAYYNNRFNLNAGLDQSVCINETQMHGDEPSNGSGVWSIEHGNGVFNTLSTYDALVTNLQEGPNIFIWTVSKTGGCTESDTVDVYFNLRPTATFITNVSTGCSPIDITYTNTSSGGATYYWYFGEDQQTDTTLQEFTRTYEARYDKDSTFTTTLITYSSAGCSDTVSKQITVFRIPKVAFKAYPYEQVFTDATVNFENLSGTSYPNYYWNYGDGTTQVDNSFIASDSHTYETWGEYLITLVASSDKCSDTASQLIKIIAPEPTNNGGRNFAGCEPLTVNFEALAEFADTFSWEFGDGATSELKNPEYIYEEPGEYYVRLYATGPGGENVFIRQDTVTVYPLPVADFVISPDTVMLPNQAVHCSNFSTNGDFYVWDFGDESDTSREENPLHYYLEAGEYKIKLNVYTKHLCFDSKILSEPVVVLAPGVLRFPTAFSPNPAGPSDGRWDKKDRTNDIFHPVHRGVREYKLEIFNRWGEKVFESDDPAIGWDGYIDGKMGTQDVYVWKVTAKYLNGVPIKNAGDVTLLR